MTKAEKRVAIAKDVLNQIKAKKYKAVPGTWFHDSKGQDLDDFMFCASDCNRNTVDAKKDVVDKLVGTCSVCALGSLFVSAIDKFNHTKLSVDNYSMDVDFFTNLEKDNPLLKWFTTRQLLLIESTFENQCGAWYPIDVLSPKELVHWDNAVVPAIRKYNNKYPNSTDRLKAIMNNIVRNKGTFVLPEVK